MKVQELMTTSVRTCAADDSVDCAARIMWDQDCGCVPVVDENSRVIGMITDRDICMAALMQSRRLGEITVSSAMSWRVFSCRPTDEVESAERVMREHQVRRLPVVDPQGNIVGLISLADIANRAGRARSTGQKAGSEHVSETLAKVSEPRRAVPVS